MVNIIFLLISVPILCDVFEFTIARFISYMLAFHLCNLQACQSYANVIIVPYLELKPVETSIEHTFIT